MAGTLVAPQSDATPHGQGFVHMVSLAVAAVVAITAFDFWPQGIAPL
jgi:hypothetical protein